MKRLFWLLPLLLATLVTGCLKDDPNESTIVLLGAESDVKPIEEVIPDTLLDFVADTGVMGSLTLALPTGMVPPDIQGGYLFGPRVLYKYNGDHPQANDTILLRFGGEQDSVQVLVDHVFHAGDGLIQDGDTTWFAADTTIQMTETTYFYPDGQNNRWVPCDIYGDIQEKGNVFRKKSTIAYVMGGGSEFAVYFTVDYDCEQSGAEFSLKRGYVLTGTITQMGIDHAVLACVNIEAEKKNNVTTVPENAIQSLENRIYVYRVKNQSDPNAFGMAERCKWY